MYELLTEILFWIFYGLGALLAIGLLLVINCKLYGWVLWRNMKSAYKLTALRYYMHLAERKGRNVRKGT